MSTTCVSLPDDWGLHQTVVDDDDEDVALIDLDGPVREDELNGDDGQDVEKRVEAKVCSSQYRILPQSNGRMADI